MSQRDGSNECHVICYHWEIRQIALALTYPCYRSESCDKQWLFWLERQGGIEKRICQIFVGLILCETFVKTVAKTTYRKKIKHKLNTSSTKLAKLSFGKKSSENILHTGYSQRTATEINKQVLSRQVFTPYSLPLISAAFVVVSCIDCLGITGVSYV